MADNQIIFSMKGVGKVHPPKKQVLKDIYFSFFYGAKIGVPFSYRYKGVHHDTKIMG